MDKFLKNLQTFLDEAKLENGDAFMSAARTLLAKEQGECQYSVKEKAGFLALLNLLGILQTFFNAKLYEAELPRKEPEAKQDSRSDVPPNAVLSTPRPRSRFPYHKPGHGIYHNLPTKSEPSS